MKKTIQKLKLLLCVVFLSITLPSQKANAQPGASVSYQVFYDDLSPYGQWIEDPAYGNVWVPSAGNSFRPYDTDGHWVMTEYGNMWVSDYAWGWAPFHYGRWTFDSFYGWVWIPDTDWGPAWVTWRSSNDYYGWAPMGPGVSVSMSFGNYYQPDDWWVFISPAYIYHPHWHNYYHGPRGNTVIIQHTTIINNTYVDNHRTYAAGPRAAEVKKLTNKEVTIYKVGNENKPGRTAITNNVISMYRPSVEKSGKEIAPQVKKAERPIGKPQPMGTGVKTRQDQNRNESPANKEKKIPERNPEQDKHNDRTTPQREQPANKDPEPRIQNPVRQPKEGTPNEEKKDIETPKENTPSPREEHQTLPPDGQQQMPPKEQHPREMPMPDPKENSAPNQEQPRHENNQLPREVRPPNVPEQKPSKGNRGKKEVKQENKRVEKNQDKK
ncbi:MAG: DUF6600 domain-containing protein [Bacteroidota bacterium]